MNIAKIQTFIAYAVVVLIGMVLATVAAYYVLEEIVFPMKQQSKPPQESFESITQMRGMVSLVEQGGESAGFVAVLLSSTGGEMRKVLVPRSTNECKSTEIINPVTISVGDVLDIIGESLENGDVLPCHEREHHVIKVVPPVRVVPQATTSTTSASSTQTVKTTP
ncbi:MAG: hypothetical protein RLZZ480_880 [Candidatus Parcubacteria bacterium]|jgi:hypothetical protein